MQHRQPNAVRRRSESGESGTPQQNGSSGRSNSRSGRVLVWFACVLALVGTALLTYPSIASWVSARQQAQVVASYSEFSAEASTSLQKDLAAAREYNALLTAGHDPKQLDYASQLGSAADGIMGRLKIPSIDVDLPIYHGTDDATLLRGAGHLESSHLPVGGPSTRSVLTAHRGLADAKMFSDLDQVKVGDTFSVTVRGEVLAYRTVSTEVIAPGDVEQLEPKPGQDLMTLITCTPLGINTHRILVTGERVLPTPIEEAKAGVEPPQPPPFPWWTAVVGAATLGGTAWVLRRDNALR